MKRLVIRVLVVALVGMLSWTGLLAIAPAQAATQAKSAQEEVISPDSQEYATREEAYDKAIQAAKDPNGLEKEYEKDLKIFKKENPDKANLVEEAKDAVKKVVGKE